MPEQVHPTTSGGSGTRTSGPGLKVQGFSFGFLPGSGKSTLMKHVRDSQRTTEALQNSDHKWRKLHFFFDFRAGNGLANSIEGMLRSMLYQLVEKLPEVTDHIDHMLFTGALKYDNVPCCMDNFCKAMASTSTSICAFIDGLNEFQGSASDLMRVVQVLKDRASLKICLASRQYPIFHKNLSSSHICRCETNTVLQYVCCKSCES